MAFVNGFELSKRVASFDQLGDAKLLTEVSEGPVEQMVD